MQAIILAGGLGTRLAEETASIPKPMVEIGGRPILWHIMKIYGTYGIKEFVVCVGYRSEVIRRYFADFHAYDPDVTFDLFRREATVYRGQAEPWQVRVVDTGESTMTGGRLRRIRGCLSGGTFFATYGDAVADIDLQGLLDFHWQSGKLATMTVVQMPSRFGVAHIDPCDGNIKSFGEKPVEPGEWINGGFFALEPAALDYIEKDQSVWEVDCLAALLHDGQLAAYRHTGFWHCLDTLRDKNNLNSIWDSRVVPWKCWAE